MNEELLEGIEDFLAGQITREDLEQMAKTAGVQELQAEIDFVKNSQTAIEAAGLRDQLKDLFPKEEKKAPKVVKMRTLTWRWAVAASILIIVVGYWTISTQSSGGLYAQYEYVDPGLPVLMSQSDDHLLYDALSYYSEGNYTVTESKLQAIAAQYPDNDTLIYYLGASQLYQGKVADARATLSKIDAISDSRFTDRSEWLLVLSSLKEKRMDDVKETLQTILTNPDHEFIEQARQLQAEIEE